MLPIRNILDLKPAEIISLSLSLSLYIYTYDLYPDHGSLTCEAACSKAASGCSNNLSPSLVHIYCVCPRVRGPTVGSVHPGFFGGLF